MRVAAAAICAMGVLPLTLAGCAVGPEPKTNQYLVDRTSAEFYKYGPAQAFGPDFALKRGDKVTMLRREFGYSQVQLADGTPGYVATEDLKPAPPPPAPPRPKPSSRRKSSSRPRGEPVLPVPGDPLFDVTDIPLPLPDEAPKPNP